jgi:heme exporter protein D
MLAFTHPGYVFTGWGIALVALAAYSVRTVRRGRRLAERVPPEERRWT